MIETFVTYHTPGECCPAPITAASSSNLGLLVCFVGATLQFPIRKQVSVTSEWFFVIRRYAAVIAAVEASTNTLYCFQSVGDFLVFCEYVLQAFRGINLMFSEVFCLFYTRGRSCDVHPSFQISWRRVLKLNVKSDSMPRGSNIEHTRVNIFLWVYSVASAENLLLYAENCIQGKLCCMMETTEYLASFSWQRCHFVVFFAKSFCTQTVFSNNAASLIRRTELLFRASCNAVIALAFFARFVCVESLRSRIGWLRLQILLQLMLLVPFLINN